MQQVHPAIAHHALSQDRGGRDLWKSPCLPKFIIFRQYQNIQPDCGVGRNPGNGSLTYKVTQTLRRGEAALTRDEMEALITAHNSF